MKVFQIIALLGTGAAEVSARFLMKTTHDSTQGSEFQRQGIRHKWSEVGIKHFWEKATPEQRNYYMPNGEQAGDPVREYLYQGKEGSGRQACIKWLVEKNYVNKIDADGAEGTSPSPAEQQGTSYAWTSKGVYWKKYQVLFKSTKYDGEILEVKEIEELERHGDLTSLLRKSYIREATEDDKNQNKAAAAKAKQESLDAEALRQKPWTWTEAGIIELEKDQEDYDNADSPCAGSPVKLSFQQKLEDRGVWKNAIIEGLVIRSDEA